MNLALAFLASAQKYRSDVALFWGESELRYEHVIDQSLRVSRLLISQFHVQPGARIGLWLKNCPEFVSSLFGVWLSEGTVVPINNFLRPREVAYILEDAGIDLIISDLALSEGFAELIAHRPGLRFIQVEEFANLPAPSNSAPSGPPQREEDLAVIIYTSGTTGRPKGAMLSHGNLLHNVESCRQVLKAVSFDRFVVLLPMFHSFMLTVGTLLPLLVGGSSVIIKSLQSPKAIIQEAMARQATILPAIPQFFRALAHAQLPGHPILREFNHALPIPLLEGYGLSEASPVVSINPIAGPWKPGSIGKPIPDVEMNVQNDAGAALDTLEIGEICVRGGNVMQGYWRQPEETAKALRDGWLLTGDVGYRDADGYYFITDRKKDMLLVNGINVYPREIEEIIYQYPGVKEAAVIGIPDARKGEQPLAFVSVKDDATIDDRALLTFIKEKLADYKVPRRVVFLPALPRNATGKILKTNLRDMAHHKSAPSAAG